MKRFEKNWSYTIKEGEHKGKTLWSGRYTAICGIVIYNLNGALHFLANKRGQGTPDYQGCWNLPCGFLEADESAEEGCVREVFEECGIRIKSPDLFELNNVETEPEKCNNGNVTLRYVCFISDEDDYDEMIDDSALLLDGSDNHADLRGGEENEVDDVKWIHEDEIDYYNWAFNHKEVIENIIRAVRE